MFSLEPSPDGVEGSRYVIEGPNATLPASVDDSGSEIAVQKFVPTCTSDSLNATVAVFEVRF